MNAYLEISLFPDPDFLPTTLMNALFSKLHRGLVTYGQQNIGVSFPDSGNSATLGARLRLHGKDNDLARLMELGWMTGMRDHASVGEITLVPPHAKHWVVRRVQAKSNPERERRRLILRKNVSAEVARQVIPDSTARRLRLPYFVLTSQSTGQQFRLFIEHLPPQEQAVEGKFGAYGLSSVATVPWF
ncbi:type I-F CRISPR-associated endoribonuclease Cas6/Csy4 [Nitrosovibrio sp. Nv4]|uniref:type I-F CRISPR-associated endoribonuclease Cas6/Csy4 n=1 Tax=Nitrosovibrio sp. Nv4 TaxID=1945880 RepID=UPI000BC597FE|nr:type I-F CRISPR-associated endoribonuclease Cas6/Csy4 [Nitrosovibrio sp. Nv4]SOD41656.1 CRISPR-associated protein, Csy4 family [Nitrosovibrio sp. Nv4]